MPVRIERYIEIRWIEILLNDKDKLNLIVETFFNDRRYIKKINKELLKIGF